MKDSSSFKKKLAGYSAMAGAVFAVNQRGADAQVIYHDIVPDAILSYNSSYYFDLNNDDTVDFQLYVAAFSDSYVRMYPALGNGMVDKWSHMIAAEGSCQIISSIAPSPYGWHVCTAGASTCYAEMMFELTNYNWPWSNAIDKFVEIRMHDSAGNHYGWIRMTHTLFSDSIVIEDYAYEATPDSSIVTPCATQVKDNTAPDFFNALVEDRHLIIHFHQSPLPSQMILLNEVGMKLREQQITQSELVMDVSQLAAGIYFVEVNDGEKRQVKKVVIEKR